MTPGTESLRMTAADVKRKLDAGERITFLDTRGPQAWESSDQKVRGAIRVDANAVRVDPHWPKDQLMVAYCT